MRYCTRCVYPAVAAAPLTFDENGVCSGCRIYEQRKKINWAERRKLLAKLLEEYRTKGSNYDCIIPVSGGKDSCYLLYKVKREYGLNVLAFTTDINVAASLHVLASVPNAFIMEYCVEPSDISRSLARNPIPIEGGQARVPEEPGLGVEPNPAIIEKYLVRG